MAPVPLIADLGVSPVEEVILLGVLPTDFGGWGDQALLWDARLRENFPNN